MLAKALAQSQLRWLTLRTRRHAGSYKFAACPYVADASPQRFFRTKAPLTNGKRGFWIALLYQKWKLALISAVRPAAMWA